MLVWGVDNSGGRCWEYWEWVCWGEGGCDGEGDGLIMRYTTCMWEKPEEVD